MTTSQDPTTTTTDVLTAARFVQITDPAALVDLGVDEAWHNPDREADAARTGDLWMFDEDGEVSEDLTADELCKLVSTIYVGATVEDDVRWIHTADRSYSLQSSEPVVISVWYGGMEVDEDVPATIVAALTADTFTEGTYDLT